MELGLENSDSLDENARRLVAEHSSDIILLMRPDGTIADANAAAVAAYGTDRTELLRMSCREICERCRDFTCRGSQVPDLNSAVSTETHHRRRNGELFPVGVTEIGVETAEGRYTLCVARDATDTRRWAAFQKLVHEIDLRILQHKDLGSTLRFICERLAETFRYSLVQVSLKGAGGRVDVRERAGESASFLDDIEVRWDDTPQGRGPTGTAIRTGLIQVRGLLHDSGFAPWRERAVAFGFRSAVAIPLAAQARVHGALTLFSTRDDEFSSATVEMLRGFADQVALSLQAAEHHERIRLGTAALESMASAIMITDERGVIEWVNQAFFDLTGYARDEVVGLTPRILKSGNHSEGFYKQMWATLGNGNVWRGELFNRRKDGTIYPEEQTITPVRGDDGEVTHYVAVKQDVSERYAQEERIRYLALHDPVTDLPNRRAFESALVRMVDPAREDSPGVLLIIGLDHFKPINDSLGHAAGDQLLGGIGRLLRRTVQPGDFVSRIGGDEFAIVLEGASADEADIVAERLRVAVEDYRFDYDGELFDVTASIGVCRPESGMDAKAILVGADAALYAAKERGKNRAVHFDPSTESNAWLTEAGRWATRIKSAFREGNFLLQFQPVIRMIDSSVLHYEALIRMRDSDGSLIAPEKFLSAARRFGMMPQIDRWVVERVVEILREAGEMSVFVNLSAESLSIDSMLDSIEELVQNAHLRSGQLAFEITESSAITDLAKTQSWIHRLKRLGCFFALDDFGVGFSSFSYLRTLAVDYVKLDRSFVHDLKTNSTSRALVQAVKAVAQALGKEVIAEGVENEANALALGELGIEHGQGFLWGRPMALDEWRRFPAARLATGRSVVSQAHGLNVEEETATPTSTSVRSVSPVL